jgi:hypothetical protein
VFVHGALCVAYSGQCLTSESLGGRSANRGQCAQACRLPYDLTCDGKDIDLGERKYLLSPQDLAAFDLIPQLIEAGVCSFKIEGRLKTPEYVANVTRHYRQAIDTALAGQPVKFSPREVEEMELSFSRGFSPGWLGGCDHKMLCHELVEARGVAGPRKGGGRACWSSSGCVKRGDGSVRGQARRRARRTRFDVVATSACSWRFIGRGDRFLSFSRKRVEETIRLTSRLRKTFAAVRAAATLHLVVTAPSVKSWRLRATRVRRASRRLAERPSIR